jgi:hypothetical protein
MLDYLFYYTGGKHKYYTSFMVRAKIKEKTKRLNHLPKQLFRLQISWGGVLVSSQRKHLMTKTTQIIPDYPSTLSTYPN